MFTEAASGFSTTDVRDAHDHIVQFNTAGELIWTADGTHFPGYIVQGLYIPAEPCACWLEVRFGTQDGERRAYFTADYIHDNPGTLIDIEVRGSVLAFRRTSVFPPGTYTMSGVVTEATPTGLVPLEGATVGRYYGSGSVFLKTDKDGSYEIHGLYDGSAKTYALKEGYETLMTDVAVNGNTRFDVQLVRR